MNNTSNNDSNTGTNNEEQGYVFVPKNFSLKSWTIVTGRRGGRAEFNGHLHCEKNTARNLGEFIRLNVYGKRDAGDIVLDLDDLFDIGSECYFEMLRFEDRDLSCGEVKHILKKQDSLLVLKLGTVLYLCIGHDTHIHIANMYNPETDRGELKWNVSQEPIRVTREMKEVWELSDGFRREFQAQFRAATVKDEYEPENSPFAKAMKIAKPIKAAQQWTTDGKTTALHVVQTPVEELTIDDLEVASRRKRKAKEA
jgi:hypothetical protein